MLYRQRLVRPGAFEQDVDSVPDDAHVGLADRALLDRYQEDLRLRDQLPRRRSKLQSVRAEPPGL